VAVVDDEASLREALESLLHSAGYRAACFESAEAFLGSAARQNASCLILDCRLPGMDGFELQQIVGEAVPVVFITAHERSDGRLRSRASRAGAVGFLRKPFPGLVLLDAVHRALHYCTKVQ
jgi:FixJ family two-component response regulator